MKTRKLREANKIVNRIQLIIRTVIFVFIIVFIMFALISMIVTVLLLKSWATGHVISFRSPVRIENPIIITDLSQGTKIAGQEAIVKKIKTVTEKTFKPLTEYQIVMKLKDGPLLWAMYQLETQRGKTDNCRINGQGFGGWGVKDNGTIVCYKTFELAATRAQYWLSKNKENSTLAQALCRWSGHGNVNDCTYYRNALATM